MDKAALHTNVQQKKKQMQLKSSYLLPLCEKKLGYENN